jgi:hypothetical protein
MHCYILVFIVQNFIHFIPSGKMPSDKAALCNQLASITPASAITKGKRLADLIALLPRPPPLMKGADHFKPAIKTKRQLKIYLKLPLLSPIFNI